ncbi:hypothetical protein [Tsukamurella spumae]|uniref:hypothetical protein n=1 Tax=Tsukamurella spumae TaxID=44753 RepID=UPI0031DD37B3
MAAPASAAPVTAGCAAKSQPTLSLGKADRVQVEIPAAAGWHPVAPPAGRSFTVGAIDSADGEDGITVRIAYPKQPTDKLTANDLVTAFAARDSDTFTTVGRRSLAGPCGLPTVSISQRFTDIKTKRTAYGTARYTLFQYGTTTVGVIVEVASYDQQRLADVERTILDRYGIRLPA